MGGGKSWDDEWRCSSATHPELAWSYNHPEFPSFHPSISTCFPAKLAAKRLAPLSAGLPFHSHSSSLPLCAWHKAACVCRCVLLLNGANSDSTVAPNLFQILTSLRSVLWPSTHCDSVHPQRTNERMKARLERKWAGLPGVVFAKYSTQHRPQILAAHTRRTTTLWTLVRWLPAILLQGLAPGGGMFTTVKKRRSACYSQTVASSTLFSRSLAFAVKDCIIIPAAATVQSGLHDTILFIHSGHS
jgi:hypothetical protein